MSNPKQEWLNKLLAGIVNQTADCAAAAIRHEMTVEKMKDVLAVHVAEVKDVINAKFDEAVGEDEPSHTGAVPFQADRRSPVIPENIQRNQLRKRARQAWYNLPTEAVEGRE